MSSVFIKKSQKSAPVGSVDRRLIISDDTLRSKIVKSGKKTLPLHPKYSVHILMTTLEGDISAIILGKRYYPIANALLKRTSRESQYPLSSKLSVHR